MKVYIISYYIISYESFNYKKFYKKLFFQKKTCIYMHAIMNNILFFLFLKLCMRKFYI